MMDLDLPAPPDAAPSMPLGRVIRAIFAVFGLAVRQALRGRRLIFLMALFTLPAVLAGVERWYDPGASWEEGERVLLFAMIPHALVPLTALLFACGMIQDEQEDQTLTYLMVRPVPRWGIYVAKLAAALVITATLTAVFTILTEAAVFWDRSDPWIDRALKASAASVLSLLSYLSIFGCLSLWTRKSLVIGVSYIVLFEGVFANIDFLVRQFTVVWYFRVICARWIDVDLSDYNIDLTTSPTTLECVQNLGLAIAVGVVIALASFNGREFRVKTPEGN